MRYIFILLTLAGCAPTVIAGTEHSHHSGHIGGHEAPDSKTVAAMTSYRAEAFKAAELQYQGAALAYESLPRLTSPHFEARAYDGLIQFRTKVSAPDDEFLAAQFYYNHSIKELLDYVREQKTSK